MQKIPIIYDYDFVYATRADPSWHVQIMIWQKNQNQKYIKMNVYMISIVSSCAVFGVSGLGEIRLTQ